MTKHKSGRGSPEARRRASLNYYARHKDRLKADAKRRYWEKKLAMAGTV